MNESYWERLARERAERLAAKRLRAAQDTISWPACCPICEGRGTIGVCFGSRDDEVQ